MAACACYPSWGGETDRSVGFTGKLALLNWQALDLWETLFHGCKVEDNRGRHLIRSPGLLHTWVHATRVRTRAKLPHPNTRIFNFADHYGNNSKASWAFMPPLAVWLLSERQERGGQVAGQTLLSQYLRAETGGSGAQRTLSDFKASLGYMSPCFKCSNNTQKIETKWNSNKEQKLARMRRKERSLNPLTPTIAGGTVIMETSGKTKQCCPGSRQECPTDVKEQLKNHLFRTYKERPCLLLPYP